jgi:hypothetical protein
MKTNHAWYASGLMVVGAMLIAAALPVTAQDFTVRMKDQDGKIAVHYVSRNAIRNVASNPVETDVIYRLDTGKIITLNHQKKTYTELTLAQARERFEKAMSAQQAAMRRLGMNAGTVSITKIGPGETIAGYATERYATKTPMTQGEVWVAPALEAPPAYYDIHAAGQTGVMDQIVKEMREKQVRGYLLKTVGTANMPMMKGMAFTQVATSVEKGPIPPSTFEPPAGYRKVEVR